MRQVMYKLGVLAWSLSGWTVLPSHLFAATPEDTRAMQFQIRDPESQEVVYQGRETVAVKGASEKKETVYTDLAKKELFREEATYNIDSLQMLDYQATNQVTGEETLLKAEGADAARVVYKADKEKAAREETMKLGKETFHPKMIHQLIVRHWDKLVSGQPYEFDMLLPFRFQSLGFRIVHAKSLQVGGEARESFLLQPKNFLIRAFVPRMEFQFAKGAEPEIRLYRGPCPVPVKGESNRTMDMVFLSGKNAQGV